jgi:CheY-like chemotaxis protein
MDTIAIRRVFPLRVLMDEDDADTADSVAMVLHLKGYDVRLARDGPAALSLARTQPPDVVLLDIGLPGMSGYEVAWRLKTLEGGEHLFLIAITGYGQASDRRRSSEAGIHLHLVKPSDPEFLLRVLKRLEAVAT